MKKSNLISYISAILLLFSSSYTHSEMRLRTSETFPEASLIERQLKRGISTKEDVESLLGLPNGYGGAMFPTSSKENSVWFYEDIEATGTDYGATLPFEDANEDAVSDDILPPWYL